MQYLKVIIICLLCSVFVSFSSPAIKAMDEKDIHEELKQKITDLENRIKDLENLLKISRDATDHKAESSDGWWNKKTWRKLKEGMSQEQVKKILGEPVQIIEGDRVIWYYPNFYRGKLSFDENGDLTSWIEP